MHQQGGTLAAHDISVHRGADAILERVSLAVTPGSRVGVVGPNGRGKTTLLRALAGLEELDSGSVRRNPPSLRVGYLPQERDVLAGERLLAYLQRRTGEESTVEFEGARRCRAQAGRARRRARTARRRPLRRRAKPSRSGLDPARALRRLPARRADERPRLRRPRAARALPAQARRGLRRRLARPRVPRPDGEPDLELESGTERVHHYTGGWSEYEAARERARSEHERAYTQWSEERSRFGDLHRDRREQARVAGKQASRRGTHALMSKTRAAARRVEWLERDRVEKPWQPWELRLDLAPAGRSGDLVVALEDAVVERGRIPARAGRLRRPVGRAALDRRPERERQDDADRCAARPPAALERGAAGRSRGRVRRDRTGALAVRLGRAADPVVLRRDRRCAREMRGRCWRSSTSMPTMCCGRAGVSRRVSGRGPSSRSRRRAERAVSCSTSRRTTSTCPRSRSSSAR